MGWLRENDATYVRYLFQDGETRAFPAAGLSLLSATEPSSEEVEALNGLGAKHKGGSDKSKKPRKKVIPEELRGGPDSTRKMVAAAPAITTVAQQIAAFTKLYPKGFADEKFIDQERGGHGSRKIGRQGAVDLARESFAVDPLRQALVNKGTGIAGVYKKVLAKAKTLFSIEELDGFNLFAKSPGSEQRMAEALFEMIHGEGGSAGPHIEALATALPPDLRSWRLVTFPGAFARPAELLYVDPEVTFRQAHIVGVPVPFIVTVSASTYLPLLDMAHKLSAELTKAGLAPRDLIDVHLFTAKTLSAGKKKLRGFTAPLPPRAQHGGAGGP
ncbi:MAG: hypothetical protein EOO75_16540 [Myxococcales bacterium]|nr:MAG: hypothetical protein EOO75_16540 [Myxococcales bacterium]